VVAPGERDRQRARPDGCWADVRAGHTRSENRPLYSNPVVLVEYEGRSWLVAPYGVVSWVLNARAAGRVSLRRGRKTRDYAIREVAPGEAGPVLKRYVGIASKTRAHFQASTNSPVEDFVAEASRHPVFELSLLSKDAS
jgi:hypothetical protein